MSQNKILIVDDVPANLKMLTDLLEPEGYHILAAPNGKVALKVAAGVPPREHRARDDAAFPRGVDAAIDDGGGRRSNSRPQESGPFDRRTGQ